MKKELSKKLVIMALGFLLTFAGIPVATTAQSSNSPLILNYENEASIPTYAKSADTVVRYNSEESSLVLTATDDGDGSFVNPNRIEFHGLDEYGAAVSQYPVLAVRFKLSRADIVAHTVHIRTSVSNTKAPGNKMLATPGYQATTDWQLLVIDTRDTTNANVAALNTAIGTDWGIWSSFVITFEKAASAKEGDAVAIDWIGVFSSVEEAEGYTEIPVETEPSEQILLDFNVEEAIPTYNSSSETLVTYDDVQGALKLTAADDGDGTFTLVNRIEFHDLDKLKSAISDFPVLAIRFRLSRAEVQAHTVHLRTSIAKDKNYMLATPGYQATTDWQVLVIDTRDTKNANVAALNTAIGTDWGDWASFVITFEKASSAQEGDSILIDWIGVFESIDAATAYQDDDDVVDDADGDTDIDNAQTGGNNPDTEDSQFLLLSIIVSVAALAVITRKSDRYGAKRLDLSKK